MEIERALTHAKQAIKLYGFHIEDFGYKETDTGYEIFGHLTNKQTDTTMTTKEGYKQI